MAGAVALTLAGCTVLRPDSEPPAPREPARGTVFQIDTPFDAAHAARLLADGPNTVTGRAWLRQRKGAAITCAGQPVYLVPATDYARVRIRALYGSEQRGARLDGRVLNFSPDPDAYSQRVRQTRCDADGRFRFERVASGRFFVTAVVRDRDGEHQGGPRRGSGSLMHAVDTGGGRTGGGRTIDLTLSR